MNNAVFGKNYGKCEKILNLWQQKEEETIGC